MDLDLRLRDVGIPLGVLLISVTECQGRGVTKRKRREEGRGFLGREGTRRQEDVKSSSIKKVGPLRYILRAPETRATCKRTTKFI